jgi:NCS1 family nucleobase:cation symporter-1
MVALLLATLNVNVAANVVSPANDFANVYPRRISFKMGGILTCLVGLLMQPWYWMENYGNYIFGWLVGYSGLLGPIAGILIADYFILRKRIILVEDLYQRGGFYEFTHGFGLRALAALAAGIAVALVGLFVEPLRLLYNYAWFAGFGVAFVLYLLLMRRPTPR